MKTTVKTTTFRAVRETCLRVAGLTILALAAGRTPGYADVVVFKDNALIDNAQVAAQKNKIVVFRWQDQNIYIAEKNIVKRIEQKDLDADEKLLNTYVNSTEYQVIETIEDLRKAVALELPFSIITKAALAAEGTTLTATHGAILFKNNVMITDADVLAREGKLISVGWQNQKYYINDRYFKKVISQKILDDNPTLLDDCKRYPECQFPSTFKELKKMIGI